LPIYQRRYALSALRLCAAFQLIGIQNGGIGNGFPY
jgi:hypothetical protein